MGVDLTGARFLLCACGQEGKLAYPAKIGRQGCGVKSRARAADGSALTTFLRAKALTVDPGASCEHPRLGQE